MMTLTQASQRRTLLILSDPTESAFHDLRVDLTSAGLTPLIQHYPCAFVVLDGAGLSRFRTDSRVAAIVSRCVPDEALSALPRGVHAIVRNWNYSFSREYRRIELSDRELEGQTWATTAARDGCGFKTLLRPNLLESGLLRHLRISESQRHTWERQYADRALPREGEMHRLILPHYGERLTRDLIKALNALSPYFFYEVVIPMAPTVRNFLMQVYGGLRLVGQIAVGVVIVDPAYFNPPFDLIAFQRPFTDEEREVIRQKIQSALWWLSEIEPQANLTWVFDWQHITLDLDPLPSSCPEVDSLEPLWRNPALEKLDYYGQHFAGNESGLHDYRDAMQQRTKSDYSFVILVTSFRNCWHAYASAGWVTLAARTPTSPPLLGPVLGDHQWDGFAFGVVDRLVIHEVCHLFGALDEYSGNGTPCENCTDQSGVFAIPNGNCEQCARPNQKCVMGKNEKRLCAYTQGQIGWADLFVELETSGEKWAGTDDRVWLDIGDHVFELDNPGFNDRERGHVEGYALNFINVARAEIKRIGLRKGPDGEGGEGGGWKPRRIRVWHQGDLICDEQIESWIEGNYRWWFSHTYSGDKDIVNHIYIDIRTGKDDQAGTIDDVILRLGNGGPWLLDNMGSQAFNKGKTTTFELDPGTGLHLSNLHSLEIVKSEDSINGNWLLDAIALSVNGQTIYIKENLGRWLSGNNLTFTDQI